VSARGSESGTPRVLVALSSLCAEGTPVLTLDLCRKWMAQGIEPRIMTLADRPADLAPEFQREGIPVEPLRLPAGGIGRFSALATKTYEICRRFRPRAILSMPLGWHSFTFMGGRAAGVLRTAAHVGNYPPVKAPPSALAKFRFLVQLGRSVTDRLICCSSYIQGGVIEHFGVPAAETEVIYNGVNVEAFSQRAKKALDARGLDGRAGKPFVIGFVARYEGHKDHPTLIRAASLLRQTGRSFEVWLVGEGSRRAEYERLIQELDLGGTVKLLGLRRDVPELLGQMDVYMFSAKPDEGHPVALVEAMAAGAPIMATDVGSAREVLLNGELGDLIPPADPAAMATALGRLIDSGRRGDPARIEGALKRAKGVFSIEEMAANYARVLELA